MGDRYDNEICESFALDHNAPETPSTVTYGSKRSFTWKCLSDSEHPLYEQPLPVRLNSGCPMCASLACTHPDLASEWHPVRNGDLTPYDVTHGSHRRVWWRCRRGHTWPAEVANRAHVSRPTGCSKCLLAQTSAVEIRLFAELASVLNPLLGPKAVRHQQRVLGVDKPYDNADMTIRLGPSSRAKVVAIEYDSEYYHRGREDRDRKKSDTIRAAGHHAIRVREAPLKPLHPDDVEVTTDNAYVMAASVLTRMIDRSWLDPITTQAARHYVSSGTERGSALAKKMLSDLDDRGPR